MTESLEHRRQCLAVLGLACAAALMALLPGPAVLRVPLGFLAVLVLPGYALTLALISPDERIAGVARLGLAIALSVGLLTLAVLALDRSPWHLASAPLILTVTGMTVVAALAAWWNAGPERAWATANGSRARLRPVGTVQRLATPTRMAVGVLALVALLAASMLVLVISRTPTTTELFVLGARGDAESYPRSLRVGEPAPVEIGITNREGSSQTYRVEVSGDGIEPARLDALSVGSGETYRQNLALRATAPGQDRTIQIRLYRAGQPEPYRQLQLVVDVDGPG